MGVLDGEEVSWTLGFIHVILHKSLNLVPSSVEKWGVGTRSPLLQTDFVEFQEGTQPGASILLEDLEWEKS